MTSPPDAPAPQSGKTRAPMRVLIADDSAAVRERLAELLREIPNVHIVGEASDGIEALRLVKRNRPHVAILDIQMPGANGIDVLREIRSEDQKSIVIMLTNFADGGSRKASRQRGADYFFDKMREMDKLQELLRTLSAAE